MCNIYPFNLDFKNKNFAQFPFIYDGKTVKGFTCGISSRYAGDMKYNEENLNRLALFQELGFDPAKVYGLKQIHSRDVLAVGSSAPPRSEADGMATQDKDIILSVTVADCLPVFLLDTKNYVFSLVHSGWKGTGIAINALNLMAEKYGTEPLFTAAVLGPCIGGCCYKVDQLRAASYKKDFGDDTVRENGGDFFLDMKAANINLLKNAGVKNIAVCRDCTFTDDRLGSFRREKDGFTRMLAFVKRGL